MLRQGGTRLALAALCLAALSATAGAPLFAAEAGPIGQSAGVDVQANEPDPVSHGGALYSPFSTAFDTAGAPVHTHAAPVRQDADEGSPGLVAATVTAFVAAGALVVLVRVLIAG